MQKKREICEYRDKLDKTLSSPELTNQESLKSLLRNQLKECNENILDKRTADVSKLLSKLRSVSMTDSHVSKSTNDSSSSGDWKLKHDLEDCRVMYREGLNGSPFHTLLVEGYMDGPIHECLCVTWESSLYKKWWPQFTFPAFRVLKSECLQKIRVGEQICLTRVKIPWPLMDREMLVHFIFFEYFKDGLVVILLNTISDLDSIGVSSKDISIPDSPDAVRMEAIGGLVCQKITPQRSYFRMIGDMDAKMDFMPPSLINFVARQLIGDGFRLYKKAVASVAKFDEDYSIALTEPLYTKIRKALYSTDEAIEGEPKLENGDYLPKNEHEYYGDASDYKPLHCRKSVPEIEEEEEDSEGSVSSEDGNDMANTNGDFRRRFCVSPEVKQALGTLDRVIYMLRNITPVQEAEELSPDRSSHDQTKQASLLENITSVPQKSPDRSSEDQRKQVSLLENITSVPQKSPDRSSEGQRKQVSFLENITSVPQKSQRQDLSTLMVTEEETNGFSHKEKRDETEQKQGIVNKGKKNSTLQRKRKARCFAFRSWL